LECSACRGTANKPVKDDPVGYFSLQTKIARLGLGSKS
jgi:hypothetical protein